MLLKHVFNWALIFLFVQLGVSQGSGILINSNKAFKGYTLVEQGNLGVFLLNNCGEIVHEWPMVLNTQNHPKLLPNGNILYIHKANGFNGITSIKEVDWAGVEVNHISLDETSIKLDYEIILLPNQNYLCVGRQQMSSGDFESFGYMLPGSSPTQGDVVVEVDRNTGEVVWLWRIFDHVIQDRDSLSANYGIVKDNPQLLDMGQISLYDWEFRESFMINGMDYNPGLDQIALSVRKLSEIIIIDHSTSTAEAAGNTGGNYGKGGDILFRYGNPQNYDRGDIYDRALYYQHNPKWIKYGENVGKMSCFNNGLTGPDPRSSVHIFEPKKDSSGNYEISDEASFLPTHPEVNYGYPDLFFFSDYTSGADVLPNGNILVTVGRDKRIFEVDGSTKEKVWEYDLVGSDYLFRSEKYGVDYAAFVDRDLMPDGTIEHPSSPLSCLVTKTVEIKESVLYCNYHWSCRELSVETDNYKDLFLVVFNIAGQKMYSSKVRPSNLLPDFKAGMYVVRFTKNDRLLTGKKFIVP